MNIGKLVKGVAAATGTREADAKSAIAAVFGCIADAAVKGEEVANPGFGKCAVKVRSRVRAAIRPPARQSPSQHRRRCRSRPARG